MVRLEPAQKEQIISMIKEGKSHKEIQEFFKANYQRDIASGSISYICKHAGIGKAAGTTKRAYHKKQVAPSSPADNIIKEIITLLKEVDLGYQAVFKHLRKELLQSRGQVYQMLKGAGIEVADGE
jgi:hypothetical protein